MRSGFRSFRSDIISASERGQEGQQLIAGLEPSRLGFRRGQFLQRFFFHGQVGLQIDMGGLDILMA